MNIPYFMHLLSVETLGGSGSVSALSLDFLRVAAGLCSTERLRSARCLLSLDRLRSVDCLLSDMLLGRGGGGGGGGTSSVEMEGADLLVGRAR